MSKVLRIAELRSRATAFVLREMGVSYTELVSKRRQAHLVAARALFVWIVKSHGPEFLSFPTIGRWLGGRDHTTVMHSWKNTAPALREHDRGFRLLCDRFAEQAAKAEEAETCH